MRNDAKLMTTGTTYMTHKEEDNADGLRPEPKDATANTGIADGQLVDPSALQWPSESGMKVVIPVEAMKTAVSRACLAAITGEGQSHITSEIKEMLDFFRSASAEIMGCVRIAATDDGVVFESVISRLQCQHILHDCDGVTIVEKGEICLPATELNAVCSTLLRDSDAVSLSFVPVLQGTEDPIDALLPNGNVEIGAVRGNKVVAKTMVESYPTTVFPTVEFPSAGTVKVVLSGRTAAFRGCHLAIASTIGPILCPDSPLNNVALFDGGDHVVFVGTDSLRCAIVTAKKSDFEKSSDFNVEENGRPIPILIQAEYLKPILSAAADDDVVTISTDKAGEYLYLSCGASSYRITRIEKNIAMRYPDYRRMLTMPIGTVILVDRQDCRIAIEMMRNAHSDNAPLMFFGNEVNLFGMGLTAIQRVVGKFAYKQASEKPLKSETIRLHLDHFCQGIQHMTSEQVKISFCTDETKARVEDGVDPKFLYFMHVMNPGKGYGNSGR